MEFKRSNNSVVDFTNLTAVVTLYLLLICSNTETLANATLAQ